MKVVLLFEPRDVQLTFGQSQVRVHMILNWCLWNENLGEMRLK